MRKNGEPFADDDAEGRQAGKEDQFERVGFDFPADGAEPADGQDEQDRHGHDHPEKHGPIRRVVRDAATSRLR